MRLCFIAAVFCSSLSIVIATSAQLCLHGGLPIPNRPFCDCPRPYDGDYCQRISPCGMRGVLGPGIKNCLCDENWTGENCTLRLCAHGKLMADNRCECNDGYAGEFCQLVTKCIFGELRYGRCKCDNNYEGDFCERIICDERFGRLSSKNDSCECMEGREGLTCLECIYPLYGERCEFRRKPLLLSFKVTHWALLGLIFPLFITAICCLLIYCCCCRRNVTWGGTYKQYHPPVAAKTQRTQLLLVPQPYPERNTALSDHTNPSFIALGPKNGGVGPFPVEEQNSFHH